MAKLLKPHPKQLEVFRDDHRYKVLNWGRRCFASGTQVFAEGGYKSIEHIGKGDKVLSYNPETNAPEWKTVLDTHTFGVDYDPKPMISFWYEENKITCTYDHEFYTDRGWVPIYKLVWGVMETSQRKKLKLLCEQYGAPFDYELEESRQDKSNATSKRRFWVFENGPRWTNHKSAQGGGGDLDRKSERQAPGESQERSQNGQSDRESGVGDTQGEHSAHDGKQSTGEKPRREVRDPQAERKTSAGDNGRTTKKPTPKETRFSEETIFTLRHSDRQYQGHFEGQDLEISSVEVSEVQTTHDLTVEDNANYVVQDLLVHNSGKSVLAGEYAFIKAIETQGRYFIVAPTYKQAKSIYWNDIIKTIIPKKVIHKTNDTELYIELEYIKGDIKLPTGQVINVEHDPDKPRSRIELKGADNPDSLRGVGLNGCVLDEYAFMKDGKEIWDKILRPALADKQGWGIFISTPNGTHNHFHELVIRAEKSDNYFFSHCTALDNPHFPPEEFEVARSETPEDEFMQEWMADFRSMTTSVYPLFSRNKHMVNPKDIPAEGTNVIGLDFGHTDPFAAVFVRIDKDQNWWIFDEIYETNLDLEQIANRLRDKMGSVYFTRIIGDSGGATEIDTLKKVYNLPIIGAKKGKDTIKAGIREISQKLKVREGTGKPKLFVSSICGNTVREFESYERISTKDAYGETIVSETPEDKNNHAMDALRYLALDHSEHKQPRQRRVRRYDPVTGRALS